MTPPTSTDPTRLGPNAPMCNQIEEEPGPPLYTNASGRLLMSFTSLRVYAVEYTSAAGSFLSFFSIIVDAVAL